MFSLRWLPRAGVVLSLFIALLAQTGTTAAGGPAPASSAGWHVLAPQRSLPLFHLASGVAVDHAHDVYVADPTEGRVKKLSPQGKLLASWGSDTPGAPEHWYPQGVTVDSSGQVYVLAPDQEPWQLVTSSHVVKLTSQGKVLTRWEVGGAAALAAGGQKLFVVSTDPAVPGQQGHSVRVDAYSLTGSLLTTWHTPVIQVPVVQANGVTVDTRGNVYVTVGSVDNTPRAGPTLTRHLYRFSPAGARVRIAPRGVALGPVQAADSGGNIYLAPEPYGQQGVVKLSPTGSLLARWTSFGRDTLGDTVRLAVDNRDTVYAASSYTSNTSAGSADGGLIHVLSPAGRQLARWGQLVPRHALPLGLSVAIGPRGVIYTTATGPHVFLSISPDGRTIRQLGATSSKPPVIYSPEAIAVDAAGYVYITDGIGGHVDKLSPDGRLIAQWKILNVNQGPMNGIALDRAGNIYVLALNRIVKLSPAGKIVARFGSVGTGPGQFSAPYSLTVDARGNIYVADTQNSRIQKISPRGQWLATYGSFPQLDRVLGVAVGGSGHVFAVDPIHSNVIEYAPDGAVLHSWGVPGVLPGQFGHPTGIAIDPGGNLYVLDYDNNRIQKLVRRG